MNILKLFGKMGFGVFVFVFLFSFFPRPAFALLTDVQCQEAKGSCVVNNPTCTDGKRIDGCTFGTDGQVRTCCGAKDPVQENKDVECAKVHKGRCFYQNQTKDICSAKKMELKGECESQDGAEMACCYDPNNPNTAYPDSNSTSPSGSAASLNYTPLENLPGFEGESGDFATYFKNIYLLALWIVGISALFMLVVGGFLYLSSAGNTATLGYAKKTIYGALIGLVIALISWLLLNTINADLTNLKLSGLSGAVGSGGVTAPSTPLGSAPTPGSGSGCSGIPTQSGIDRQCGDASQALSDALKCMADKVGSGKMELSSISDSEGFSRCQNNYSRPPCAHTQNSCHYGGSNKAPKSCAADISTKGSSASDSIIMTAARECGVPMVNYEGNHIHISVKGCTCDGHS